MGIFQRRHSTSFFSADFYVFWVAESDFLFCQLEMCLKKIITHSDSDDEDTITFVTGVLESLLFRRLLERLVSDPLELQILALSSLS